MTDLDPIEPRDAVAMYINQRESESADKTVENIRNHLDSFVQWCEQSDIGNLNELTGRTLYEYRMWRQDGIAQTALSPQS